MAKKELTNKVLTKTNIAILDQGFVSAVNFATGLILARYLGMEGYGIFVLVYGIVLFVSGLQMAFLISPLMVIAPRLENKESDVYYIHILFIQLILLVIVCLLVLLAGFYLDKYLYEWNVNRFIEPLVFALSGFLVQDFYRRCFFSNNNIFYALICDFISYGLQISILLYCSLYKNLDVYLTLLIMGSTSFIAVLYAVIGLVKIKKINLKLLSFKELNSIMAEHWGVGKWLLGRTLIYWSSTQAIMYFSAFMLSVTAVGAMAATRNVVGIINILFLALENIVPSRTSSALKNEGVEGLKRYLHRVSKLGGIATFFIAGVASIAPEFWLNIIYKGEYQGYGWMVVAWSSYFFIGFFHRPVSAGLRAFNNTKPIFVSSIISVFLTVVLIYPAIYFNGLYGVMETLCVLQLSILLSLLIFYRKCEEKYT